MLRGRNLLPKMLKLMVTYENLCVHRGKQIHHIFLFKIYFLFCWVFIAAQGLSLVAVSGGLFLVVHRLLLCCRTQAVGAWASVCVLWGLSNCDSWAPEHWLSSCSTRDLVPLLHVGTSETRDRIRDPCIGRQILNH